MMIHLYFLVILVIRREITTMKKIKKRKD